MDSTHSTDVEQELASLCGVLNQSYARLVALVAGALSDESWAIGGVRSPEHWLTMRAGLSPFRARQIVAVARRRAELPAVMGEFDDGQLSLDQVSVVARYAPAHVEASVAEFAVHASVPQLRRSLSRYSFDPPARPGQVQRITTCDTDAEARGMASAEVATWNGFAVVEDRSTAPAELSMSYDEWGRFSMRFSAPADLGALVEAALKEAKDALFLAGRPEITWGDALTDIAHRSMGAVRSINRRDAFRTYVHLDTDGGWLNGRPRLPKHITDKLTCDGILQPVWITGGAPVNVGRSQRIVPTRTRRLVEDRDRGCRFPGCAANAHLECHHVVHWANGGPTDTPNLACLCPFHHDAHHDSDFTIKGNADDPGGLTFTTRHGQPIQPGPSYTTPTCWPKGSMSPPSASPQPPPPTAGSPPQPQTPPPTAGSMSPALPPTRAYRGPSGETLNLRLVSFCEPQGPDAKPSATDLSSTG